MKYGIILMLALLAGLHALAAVAAGHRPSEISVGYTPQWPTPAQFAQIKKTFDYALGMKVNWVAYASGEAMNAALADGRLQIGYSQGHVPFIVGVSQGLELTMVGVAVNYPNNDNCIVRDGTGGSPPIIAIITNIPKASIVARMANTPMNASDARGLLT